MAMFKFVKNPSSVQDHLQYKDGFIRVISISLGNNIPGQYHARVEFGRWASKIDFIAKKPPIDTFGYDILQDEQPEVVDENGNVIRAKIKALGDFLRNYDLLYSEVKRAIYIEFRDQPELKDGIEDGEDIK